MEIVCSVDAYFSESVNVIKDAEFQNSLNIGIVQVHRLIIRKFKKQKSKTLSSVAIQIKFHITFPLPVNIPMSYILKNSAIQTTIKKVLKNTYLILN